MQFIEGDTENKSRSVQSSKSKQFHNQHNSEDGGSRTNKKKHSKTASKENGSTTSNSRHELKVNNIWCKYICVDTQAWGLYLFTKPSAHFILSTELDIDWS